MTNWKFWNESITARVIELSNKWKFQWPRPVLRRRNLNTGKKCNRWKSRSAGEKTHLAVRIRYINRISFLLFKSAEQVSPSVYATNSKFSRRRFPLEEKKPSNSTTIQTRFTFPQNICSTRKQFLNYSEFFRFHPICKSDSNLHFIKKFKIFNKKKFHWMRNQFVVFLKKCHKCKRYIPEQFKKNQNFKIK